MLFCVVGVSMKDPLNNFEIPDEWIRRSQIPRDELEKRILSGLAVLLSDGSVLKRGYTTGTTMAAAAKAAVLSLGGLSAESISVPTPSGIRAEMDVEYAESGSAGVRKVQNDHESDITRGVLFCAKASVIPKKSESPVVITGGEGIGIIQRSGFETPVGEYAINPKPKEQIYASVLEALEEIKEASGNDSILSANADPFFPGNEDMHILVELSIPEGLELSRKTLNERIGIVGGISILGTTGFVEPWNDHLGEMKDDIIKCSKKVVLTTGRQGMAYSTMLFPGYDVVLVGSRITEGIESAVCADDIIVCGLPGLVLKWGDPEMMKGSGYATVVEMLDLDPQNPRIEHAFKMAVKKGKGARIVVIDRNGNVLKDSKNGVDPL